ncbi:MAG: hypothetical protein QF559_00335 [Candidatus Nitrosopelagicus sp.]|mgnify:FL=1|jgi:hypothetical protein|nr:hypothetical protein [Candidatus Nitrosopelagicus sp.]
MDFVAQIAQKTCQEILEFDKKIRFVGISKNNGKFLAGAFNTAVEYLVDKEEYKMSLHYAHMRWDMRKHLSYKIGNPIYAYAEYEKIKQIGLPLNNTDLLLISLEPDADHEKVIKFVREKMGK